MLKGPELGAAIEAAIQKKGITQKQLAGDFGIKPPSVQGWIKTGRISKERFFALLAYFKDDVDAEHWGLSPEEAPSFYSPDYHAIHEQVEKAGGFKSLDANEIRAKNAAAKASSPADLVKAMLESKAGKALPAEARERLLRAAEEEPVPEPKSGTVITADFSRSARVVNGDVLIPQYNVRGSMGHGQVVGEYVEFVRNMVVAGSELGRLGLEITSPSNLSIITGWGQSMAPTIKDKDPVVVDRGVTSYQDDGIYVITWDNHLFIKRLHKAAGGKLKIISDCRPHDSDTVDPEDIYVHGKVLYIWNGSKA